MSKAKSTPSAIAAFVASDDTAKAAVSTPAGAWPFPTTAAQLVGEQVAKPAQSKIPAKRMSVTDKAGAKVAAQQFDSPIKFIVRGDFATNLFAHTAAWLELSGLIHGGSAPLNLVKEMGGSAYSYHFKQGNFTAPSGGMVELTAKGLTHFRSREDGSNTRQMVDQESKEHYMFMMQDGLHDDRLIKNQSAIRPYVAK